MAHDGLMQVRWSLALSFLLPAGLAALLEIGWSGADPHVQVLLVVGTGLLSTAVTWLVARQAHAAQSALLAEVGRREAVEAELRERTLSLGQREAFLTSLVDILSVEVFAVDPAGRPVLWNAASRNAFGVAAGPDGVPESWREEFRLLDLDGAEIPLGDQPLPRALRGESVPTREVMITVPGLPVRRVLMSAATIRMPDGGIVGGVLAGHDVSALRARERELERLVQDLDAIARAKTAVLSGTDARTAICQAAREITGATVASLMEPTADATALVLTRSSPAHSTDF
ncbi:MAG: putative Diguanylate kinase, partial [Frankiales bacterium]|nr:putative Diguanylate kinase [Frankiales bacterium]